MVNFITSFIQQHFNAELVFPAIILIVSVILSLLLRSSGKVKREIALSPLHILIIGAFVSMFALFYAPCKALANSTLTGIADSIVAAAKMFGFNTQASEIRSMLSAAGVELRDFSNAFISVVSVYVPLLTVTAALSIFKDTVTQIKYGLFFWCKAHVFSELNEKSICLAKDIRKNDRTAKIIFTSANRLDDAKNQQGLAAQAKEIGALLTRKSVLDFHHRTHRNPAVYLIDSEETNNIRNCIELYKKYRNKPCNINVFSTLESAETFIDAIDKKDEAKAKIALINHAQIIAYDLLAKYPMFEAAERCNSDTMSVLVIGAQAVGTECAKAALWCGRMNNYKFRLRIIGTEAQKENFTMKYGDLATELEKTGASSDFYFLAADFDRSDFTDTLSLCSDANYIIVATDSDERTINIATLVRKHFAKNKVAAHTYSPENEPTVIPIISNVDYYKVLESIQKNSDICNIFRPYGCYCDIYKVSTITDWPIEKMAEQIHGLYCGDGKANNYHALSQTEKRSNRANAVHAIYKMKDAGIDFCKPDSASSKAKYISCGKAELPEEKLNGYLNTVPDGENKTRLDKLVELEHDRWSVFQVLDGWTSWNTEEINSCLNQENVEHIGQHKLPTARLHGCIIPNEKLRDAGQTLYGDPEYFIVHDRNVTSLIGTNMLDIINRQINATNKDEHILIFVPEEDLI